MSGLQETPPSYRHRWLRIGLLLLGYGLIMVLGHFGGRWLEHKFAFDPVNTQSVGMQVALLSGLLIYVILLALPFVPGIEISLALFAAFGAKVALPIYGATLIALTIAYAAGRYVPLAVLASFFVIWP